MQYNWLVVFPRSGRSYDLPEQFRMALGRYSRLNELVIYNPRIMITYLICDGSDSSISVTHRWPAWDDYQVAGSDRLRWICLGFAQIGMWILLLLQLTESTTKWPRWVLKRFAGHCRRYTPSHSNLHSGHPANSKLSMSMPSVWAFLWTHGCWQSTGWTGWTFVELVERWKGGELS